MINLLKKYEQLISYAIFGVLTTIVNIVSFWFFENIINWNYFWSNNIAWLLSVLFALFTNKTFVFKSKYTTLVAFIKEAIAFFGARIASLVIDDLIMFVGISLLHFSSLPVKIVDQFVVIAMNYVLSKIIFKSDPLKGKKDVQEIKNGE
ncbi:GtrA family protein [Agrilactobacillus yilanensis]|uniref:GtrA family protein n=1 Tax=Agrilactobacillus yilanensis TaxID=2485997 RepID=A0ABW4J3Q5_9LACO|nr:GtrA family protein [Agrilactobacillus yilanensis]